MASMFLLLAVCAAAFGQQRPVDSATAPVRTVPDSSLGAQGATSAGAVALDLVAPAQFDSFLTVLSRLGVIIDKRAVAAMGRLPRHADSVQTLFVITLDESGQPHRSQYALPSGPRPAPIFAGAAPSPRATEKLPPKLRQDGRVYFMINSAVKSLWTYPVGLAYAFPGISAQVETGVTFLAVGASLYGSYAFTRNKELGYGKVEMMNYGGDLGIAYPLLLSAFGETSVGFRYGDQLRGWGQMIGFPLGIFGGSFANFTGNFNYGNASIMTSESKFGFLYGFLIPLYFSDFGSSEYVSLSTGLTMALIPAGFFAGKLLVGDGLISSGRSAFVTTSAILGALTGALIPTLWEDKSKELYATTTLLGHILGTLYGFTYMGDRSYSFGQGMFMAASAAVGTGVAEAMPLIAQSNSHQFYTVAGFVGSWGGLMLGEVLARALFEKSGRDNTKTSSITFPGLWQLPLVWACSKSEVKGMVTGNVPIVEVTF
jgi:hypothetical protein